MAGQKEDSTERHETLALRKIGISPGYTDTAFTFYSIVTPLNHVLAVVSESPIHVTTRGDPFRMVNTMWVMGDQAGGSYWNSFRSIDEALAYVQKEWEKRR